MQVEAREEATLAKPEQLMAKQLDTTFSVDPMFHRMSALFDEGGANGEAILACPCMPVATCGSGTSTTTSRCLL